MKINNGTLFKLLEKHMDAHAKFTHGTYNPQDPTAYTDGTAYVYMWYNPLAKEAPEPNNNEPHGPEPVYYEVRYHDVTWGVELHITEIHETSQKRITRAPDGPFPNGIYLDHQSDSLGRNENEEVTQRLILALLTCGEWSCSKPTFNPEYCEPDECPSKYI